MNVKLLDRKASNLSISEFNDNQEQGKYNYDPPYQRKNEVWSEDKKSFLIDSILKNYPIPPIFMRPNIGDDGKTKYDVIDGKQRLNAIIGFINGSVALPNYFSEDVSSSSNDKDLSNEMNGKTFDEIKKEKKFSGFVKQFWTYSINIEFLYEDADEELINNVFDRLNRNGEPLNRQELRNAKFYNSDILKSIKDSAKTVYWSERLKKLKDERMEDEEFISELYRLVAKSEITDSTPQIIDEFYEEYAKKPNCEITAIVNQFNEITDFIDALGFDYDQLKKLSASTHLYGLFSFAWFCMKNQVEPTKVKNALLSLYTEYFGKTSSEYSNNLAGYKASCSSRTRSKQQRENRLASIKTYCNITN